MKFRGKNYKAEASKIENIDIQANLANVLLDLFGQETSVEVEISQIEKA